MNNKKQKQKQSSRDEINLSHKHNRSPSCSKPEVLLSGPVVNIKKKSVYTVSVLLNRAKIKFQTRCFSDTFVTRRGDDRPLISVCTQSRWTADLLSQRYPTRTVLKSVVGGLPVSVWDACTTFIREKVRYREDLGHPGVYSSLSKSGPTRGHGPLACHHKALESKISPHIFTHWKLGKCSRAAVRKGGTKTYL